jgi:DNA-binding NarL/FixJ family response regulator
MTMTSAVERRNGIGVDHPIEARPTEVGKSVGKDDCERSIAIIDNRALDRECLARSLGSHYCGAPVSTFATLDELRKKNYRSMSIILLSIGGLKITDAGVADDINRLKSEFAAIPFIIVADNEDPAQVLKALEYGACGYIPTTVGIGVAVGAVELALAGGVFVPASTILSMRGLLASNGEKERRMPSIFTARQSDVAEALRCGKANKIIAYELNMCESTVKVHVRNIMRKLKATNRTEAAYKMDALFPHDASVST